MPETAGKAYSRNLRLVRSLRELRWPTITLLVHGADVRCVNHTSVAAPDGQPRIRSQSSVASDTPAGTLGATSDVTDLSSMPRSPRSFCHCDELIWRARTANMLRHNRSRP